ncbi:hypothetical protein DAPPUDRAFT_123350 [Daphnia pulex]|uniref:Uncharacterized protein n=1 Tax=Daphnia pulex TaxID=6669 RepID=E9I5Q0_DAPPU|nr:hypothetical protein DAPPUDRAFT_123350 [Daphnia pulex]|eukprot:EFX60680.1 hypothetical protein DAPPUDRAFT_123350 [Daphnia pulex]
MDHSRENTDAGESSNTFCNNHRLHYAILAQRNRRSSLLISSIPKFISSEFRLVIGTQAHLLPEQTVVAISIMMTQLETMTARQGLDVGTLFTPMSKLTPCVAWFVSWKTRKKSATLYTVR